jgi:hypothetical protein
MDIICEKNKQIWICICAYEPEDEYGLDFYRGTILITGSKQWWISRC